MATKPKSAKADRSDYLLRKVADALEHGAIPFAGDWLIEHEVTSEEVINLANRTSVILNGFLASKPEDQTHIISLGAVAVGAPEMLELMRPSLEVSRATKRLERACGKKGGK